jgi:endonuclease/exonuclease/phosphatase family metal-dependent hydrolase
MYVNKTQKIFTYMGYYANEFAREAVRSIERLTRPMPTGKTYFAEVGERIKRIIAALFSIPLAAALLFPAFICYVFAACVGRGRFELIELESSEGFWHLLSVKVMSLNACLQDPWSPFTGGVVPPFEPVTSCISRIAGLVSAIAKEDPILYLGQEFENLGAQDACIRLMQQNGFRYFIRDLGSNDPIRNNSGLFVASKVPLQNIEFIPYPAKDRAGLAKWSRQGALTFTISIQGRDMRFVNIHLNHGKGKENQDARNRQLTCHVAPLLKRGNCALFGDLNFDTASIEIANLGLLEFVNELEGKITCTDAGKHALRHKSMQLQGQPCADCEERIDGLIYNPCQIRVVDCFVKPFILSNQLLSDHYATIATLQIPDLNI